MTIIKKVIKLNCKLQRNMKQFRIVINEIASEWLNQAEWTIQDLEQFQEVENYYIEYREI